MSRMILELRPTDSKVFWLTFTRQIRRYVNNFNELLHHCLYFVFSLVIFQIAIGDTQLSSNIYVGIILSSLILSLLLGLQTFFKEDYNNGTLAQLLLTSVMFETIIIAKALAFIALNSLIFLIALPVAGLLFSLDQSIVFSILLSGMLTIFGTTFVSVFCSSIILGSQSRSLYATITLPLLVPILIFSTLGVSENFYLWFLASYNVVGFFIFTISTRYVIESIIE